MCKQFVVEPCGLFGVDCCLMLLCACAFGTGFPSIEVTARKLSLTS